MKALVYLGIQDVKAESVPDPAILNPSDIIVKVSASSVCGSDLHLLHGLVPSMREGDILGHEFIGEVVEVGPAVQKHRKGERVVVGSILGCGGCFFCNVGEHSLCDNSNPNPSMTEKAFGHHTAGIFGYSHAFGGYAGSHAEYIRVPYGDMSAYAVPEGLTDEQALFASDAMPTGFMGADLLGIRPGDVVAVWGAGGVGLMAMQSARVLGAERIIAIDNQPVRLEMAERHAGAETINFDHVDDVVEVLKEMTAGRGPDRCVDAVGMEPYADGLLGAYDKVKQALRLQTDRPTVIRQIIMACRKGGTISIMGVYGGFVDKFPLGAAMNKGLTFRMGQQHSPRYVPHMLELVANGAIDPSYLITHRFSLEDGQKGYDIFSKRTDGVQRVVFTPGA